MCNYKMVSNKVLYPALLFAALSLQNANAETKWLFEGEGNDVRCYDIKNGKKKFVCGTTIVEQNMLTEASFYVDMRINDKNKLIKKLSEEYNYYDALYNYKYFDAKKASQTAENFSKEKKIRGIDKKLFIDACRKWPFIKFYSKHCSKKIYPLDEHLSYLIFSTENKFEDNQGACGEIGTAQLMPSTAKIGIKAWKKSPYWIEGQGIENPINNMIGGIQHIISCCKYAGCRKKVINMTEEDLKAIYTCYVSGKDRYEDTNYWIRNISENIKYFYLLPYIEEATAGNGFVTQEGKKKLRKNKAKRYVISQ